MEGTQSLGNDPRWGNGTRELAAKAIAGAPPSATFARCTVYGDINGVYCMMEYFPNVGKVATSPELFETALSIVDVWFDHNADFQGLTFTLAKQPDGDWKIEIDFATPEMAQAAIEVTARSNLGPYAQVNQPQPTQQGGYETSEENAYATGGYPVGENPVPDEREAYQEEAEAYQQEEASAPRRSRAARAGMINSQTEARGPAWLKPVLIGLACLIVLGGMGGGIAYFLANNKPPEPPKPFAELRKSFETNLAKRMEAPQEYDNEAPDDVKIVEYTSAERQLRAWLILPDREPPFPAVVYAHDGFAMGRKDLDAARPFMQHGFAVLIPTWRAENGNPGDFEMCYGEVDDLVAAIDYLAARKKIDRDNIFAAGYGVGATNVMLACELTDKLRKAAALAGRPDMLEAGEAYEHAPFDQRDENERKMRSPAHFLDDLKCPMLLLYGTKDPADKLFLEQARKMEKVSKKQPILVEELEGESHQSSLAPAINRMITFFNAR